jgi:hypothetical protein
LKLLRGTHRGEAGEAAEGPALPAVDAAPPPPAWLREPEALREWHRLAPLLVANRLLHAGNVGLLAQACAVHGRLARTWQEGGTPPAALVAAYRMLCNSLGMLGWQAPGSAQNRFADHRPGRVAKQG